MNEEITSDLFISRDVKVCTFEHTSCKPHLRAQAPAFERKGFFTYLCLNKPRIFYM